MNLLIKMKRVSKVILINDKKEFLLYLRDEKKEIPYPGYWDLIGGEVEDNESFLEGAKREIIEEIELNLDNLCELGKIILKKEEGVKNVVLIHIFLAKINLPVELIRLNEGQRLKYFKLKDLSQINLIDPLKNFIFENKSKIFD